MKAAIVPGYLQMSPGFSRIPITFFQSTTLNLIFAIFSLVDSLMTPRHDMPSKHSGSILRQIVLPSPSEKIEIYFYYFHI